MEKNQNPKWRSLCIMNAAASEARKRKRKKNYTYASGIYGIDLCTSFFFVVAVVVEMKRDQEFIRKPTTYTIYLHI